MKDPLVSFCLPTHNRAEYLAECLDSCLNQTYTNIEVVVADDGSTDSTPVLMKYYEQLDSRITYITKIHGGIALTRNAAIQAARGDYIAVMDSDDLCGPDRIKRQMKELQKGFDVCYSSYLRADENATVIDGVKAPKPKELTKEYLLKDQGIPHVTITARKQCFIDHPYQDKFTSNDDYALVVSWIQAGYKLAMIADPLMIVRFHEQNTSRTDWEQIKVFNEEVREGLRAQ